ncbi:FAD-dependent oxidoreductase [[Eubacterium] cellulosolvens]
MAKNKAKVEAQNSVLVVGSGMAGIRASLDLAEAGYKVSLLEHQPNLGGVLMQLDRQFPTNDCGICKMLPTIMREDISECCLRRNLTHPNINVYTNATVSKVSGEAGNFSVNIQQKPEFVDPLKCILCGKCEMVCPVEVPNVFNDNLNTRKAIYTPYPLPNPNIYTLDIENCTKCGKCIEICPTSAINLEAAERNLELSANAIILAPGLQVFDPEPNKAYGYGTSPNILTSIDFERIYSGLGPYSGARKLVRPSDKKVPKNLAFIQCVGSRSTQFGHEYCSFACCMYSLKEAMLAKEQHPDMEVTIYFMDMRAFGKGYHEYYEHAKARGIHFIRSRVPNVQPIPGSDNLELTLVSETGELVKVDYELVVLGVGLEAPGYAKELAELFKIKLNEYNFTATDEYTPVASSREGVYVCGGFTGPKDIPETVTEASAAAALAAQNLAAPQFDDIPEPKVDVEEPSAAANIDEPAIGIIICKCGTEIESKIDLAELREFAKNLDGVIFVDETEYLCIKPEVIEAQLAAAPKKINRLILAACTPYPFELRFKTHARQSGLDPSMLELVDLRERLAWVSEDRTLSTALAKGQLAIAHEKLLAKNGLPQKSIMELVTKRALVVGGGITGMSAALTIANNGFQVDLVERTDTLGGNLKDIYSTLTHEDTQGFLKEMIKTVDSHETLTVHLNSNVKEITGYVGNFQATISKQLKTDDIITTAYGAIVLATGAEQYEPNEYLYGSNPRVLTQLEFEAVLAGNKLEAKDKWEIAKNSSKVKTIAMIQCVGSRNAEHPYCSRVCCVKAIKNALKFKKQNPKAKVYILYQDIMVYGLQEKYYLAARKAGIEFVRYEPEMAPSVSALKGSDRITVKVQDILLKQDLILEPELLILSTGIVPNQTGLRVFEELGLEYTKSKFLKEANVKFRPVDLLADGIFIAGLAHSPRQLTESIVQAQAAAGRVITILNKPALPSRREVAEVNARRCSGCEACIAACPYHARVMDYDEKVAVVIEPLCQVCGVCTMICPNAAASLRGFSKGQVYSMIDAAVD